MILITGGAGYIGSHVNMILNEKGYETLVIDNLSTGSKYLAKWGHFIKGDIGNTKLMDEIFLTYSIDCVMHFAASAYVGESMQNPKKYYINNMKKSLDLLNSMIKNNVKKIIFSSTCATYGNPKINPIEESTPQLPINPYGRTKLIIEGLLKDYCIYGLDHIILRYFNAAGASYKCKIGEIHDPEPHLIPRVINSIKNRDEILIYGDDYDTPDGTAIRDYIHVSDIANAHVLCLEYLMETKKSNFFNLGNGNGYSVKEIIKTTEMILNKSAKIKIEPRRKGDPPKLVGSSNKIKKIIGWNPTYSNIKDILSSAIKWDEMKHLQITDF